MAKVSKLRKQINNIAYNVGASIVILGALGKILHMPILGIPGGTVLMIGLITEAIIFLISAFEPVEDEVDWSLVYPELAGGKPKEREAIVKNVQGSSESNTLLSSKLDEMLKEAQLDVNLMRNLGSSISSLSHSAEQLQPIVSSVSNTNRYAEQISLATSHMESLNSLYKLQLESANKHTKVNENILNSATQLQDQMQHMSSNLYNLNTVYGGMLSAMTTRR